MRSFALLLSSSMGLLALFGVAGAADDPRFLSDPAWLPHAGQFDGSTSFTMSETSGNTYDSTGAFASHFYGQSDRISQTIGYGFTDDLSLDLGISYLPFDKVNRYPVGGAPIVRESSGFTDPTIGLTWRAIEQGASPVNFDVFGSYSPDWLGATAATAISHGTEGRGGQGGQVGLAVSHVMPMFTIYGSAAANFIGRRDVFDPVTGTSALRSSTMNWTLALDTQTRFNDALSFNAGVGETFGQNRTTIIGPTGVEHLGDLGDRTDLHFAANYSVIPQTLVGSLTYAHNFGGTSHEVFPTDPASDTSTRGRQANIYGVQLTYAFN
jgi:hypothetical protein